MTQFFRTSFFFLDDTQTAGKQTNDSRKKNTVVRVMPVMPNESQPFHSFTLDDTRLTEEMYKESDDEGDDGDDEQEEGEDPDLSPTTALGGLELHVVGRGGAGVQVVLAPGGLSVVGGVAVGPLVRRLRVLLEERVVVAGLQQSDVLVTYTSVEHPQRDVPHEVRGHAGPTRPDPFLPAPGPTLPSWPDPRGALPASPTRECSLGGGKQRPSYCLNSTELRLSLLGW